MNKHEFNTNIEEIQKKLDFIGHGLAIIMKNQDILDKKMLILFSKMVQNGSGIINPATGMQFKGVIEDDKTKV